MANYYFINRRERVVHQRGEVPTTRGVFVPTTRDMFEQLRSGQDISQYMDNSPFYDDSYIQYMEFDDIFNQNRMLLDSVGDISVLEAPQSEHEPPATTSASADEGA